MAFAKLKVAAIGVAFVYFAASAGGKGSPVHAILADAGPGPVPAGGPYTPRAWAHTFLGVIGEPQTSCNVAAIEAWAAAEGGAWGGDGATANPMNTTQPEPGDSSINSVGVKAYPSWQEGLQGNATAIENGLYGPVLSALSAGNNAQAVADAVANSPWGTSPFTANC